MSKASEAAELGAEIARHDAVAYIEGADPSRPGVIRDGGYRCACGAVYGVREYVPSIASDGRRVERIPRPVGLTKEEHLGEVALRWLAARR